MNPLNLDICAVNFIADNEGIQREKAALKFPFWQKTRFAHAIAPNKRANSHNLETVLTLLTISFYLLTEQGYTSFINSGSNRKIWIRLSFKGGNCGNQGSSTVSLKLFCFASQLTFLIASRCNSTKKSRTNCFDNSVRFFFSSSF